MKNLFIISSISASGKTTLVEHIIKKFDLYKLKTCTTREIREEESGDEYHFLSMADFTKMFRKDKFIEHANVYGEQYGLTKDEVENNSDKDCILITDVKGAATLTDLYPRAISIFIEPPDMEEIIKRLTSRKTGDFTNRYLEAEKELKAMGSYDHVLKVGNLDEMKENLEKLIKNFI